MLDTYGKKYVAGLLKRSSKFLIKLGLTPNQVTALAFVLGICSSFILLLGHPLFAVAMLWASGYLDAVDGEMARRLRISSGFGAQLDIVSDRIVELSIVIALSIIHTQSRMIMILLISSILISMTIFLTSGMILKNKTKKSFYYQAGLMERTEGFIAFSLMMLFQQHLNFIGAVFTILICFTAFQRIRESYLLTQKGV